MAIAEAALADSRALFLSMVTLWAEHIRQPLLNPK
jgi:hypothetical protein